MTQRRGLRRALLIVVALCAAAAIWQLQRGRATPPPRPADLGWVQDPLGGQVLATELCGGLPAVVCVGAASHVETLLAVRARTDDARAYLVDVSALDDLAREALEARLVEAALDEGGAIGIDVTGASVRALEGAHVGPVRVSLDARGVVTERQPLEVRAP